MQKIYLISLVLLMISSTASAEEKSSFQDAMKAAASLKKAAVEKEWEECISAGGLEVRCKQLLSYLHEQEQKVLLKISDQIKTYEIDLDFLNIKMTDCHYGPYSSVISCWKRLAARIDEEAAGKFLIID